MKKRTKVILISSLAMLGLMVAVSAWWFWFRNKMEILSLSDEE